MKIRVSKELSTTGGMLWSSLYLKNGARLRELDATITPDLAYQDTAETVGEKIPGLAMLNFITPVEGFGPFGLEIRSFGKDPKTNDERVYVRLHGIAGGFEKVEAQAEGVKFYVSGLPTGAVVTNQNDKGEAIPRVLSIMMGV